MRHAGGTSANTRLCASSATPNRQPRSQMCHRGATWQARQTLPKCCTSQTSWHDETSQSVLRCPRHKACSHAVLRGAGPAAAGTTVETATHSTALRQHDTTHHNHTHTGPSLPYGQRANSKQQNTFVCVMQHHTVKITNDTHLVRRRD